MPDNKPEQEQSIEEILASIRQIISDDSDTREAGDIEAPADEHFDIPLHNPVEEDEPAIPSADVLDLTDEVMADEPAVFTTTEESFDIPVHEPEVEEVYARESNIDLSVRAEPTSAQQGDDDIDALFSAPAASATTEAFSRLIGNIPVEREENKRLYADGRITLEDIAKDLLRPMLRQWIDDHMPPLVERLVEKELEKLARQARD